MTEPLRLRISLDFHDCVKPLRDGRVTSNRLAFEFVDLQPLPKAFREMIRGDSLDLSEMAIITHLLAHHFNKPFKGLAIPLWTRFPHTNLMCPAQSTLQPSDLNGRKVGVRAYAQTSGVWVRGVLAHDYGVDLNSVTWGTMEDAHLAEFVDPPNTRRYTPPPGLRDLMFQGEFAAIMGERIVDPASVRTLIPDAANAARDWIARSGITPINHILAIRTELTQSHPWLVEELMVLFSRARELAIADGAQAPPPYGLEANRFSLQKGMQYAAEQNVTPREYSVDEMFFPL